MCLFKTKCSHQVYYGSKESAAGGAVGSAYEIREWLSSLLNDLASVFRQELVELLKKKKMREVPKTQWFLYSGISPEDFPGSLILRYVEDMNLLEFQPKVRMC